jgi:hypothetical protein
VKSAELFMTSNSHYRNPGDASVLVCSNLLAETPILPFNNLDENQFEGISFSTNVSKMGIAGL